MLLFGSRKKHKSPTLTYTGMPVDEKTVKKSNHSIRNHIPTHCRNEGCEFLDDAIRIFDQPATADGPHFTRFENTNRQLH